MTELQTAQVQLQNQKFDVPFDLIALNPEIIQAKGEDEAKKVRESNLKRWLSQLSPAATNATLAWSEEDQTDGSKKTIIKVTPQLGTKGVGGHADRLHDLLCDLPQEVHPITALTFELKMVQLSGGFTGPQAPQRLFSYQQRINDALDQDQGRTHLQNYHVTTRLRDARPIPSPRVPLGF